MALRCPCVASSLQRGAVSSGAQKGFCPFSCEPCQGQWTGTCPHQASSCLTLTYMRFVCLSSHTADFLAGRDACSRVQAQPTQPSCSSGAEDMGLGLKNALLELVFQLPLPVTISKNNQGPKLEKARILSYFTN